MCSTHAAEMYSETTKKREKMLTFSYGLPASLRAGPRDVVAEGALKAEVLNRAAKAARGGGV